MRRYLREREETVPFLVQANKQDAPDAHSPEELARVLRLGPDVATFGAVASDGAGVRETFNAAVRAAVAHAKRRVKEVGIGAISGQAQGADALFETMLELEDSAEDLAPEEEPSEDEMNDVAASSA
jgi:hypothetical protein